MPSQDQNHDSHESSSLPDFGDAIDMNTFGQILEMDDSEDDRDFSQGIVFDFFEQVQETFERMDAALGVIRPGNSQRSQKAHPCHQHARGSVLGSGRPTDDTRYDSEAKDLSELYRLGHFLKGSSATLGLTKVKDSCEKIQRYGKKENLDGSPEPNEELCLSRVTETLAQVKLEFAEAEKTLQNFYRT